MWLNKKLTLRVFRRHYINSRKDLQEEENYKIINPLNANPEKWSNTLKQIVGNLPTICLSVFDHFMNLALKGLRLLFTSIYTNIKKGLRIFH